ncbi:putative GCN5-related N-acetyltransferase [Candidatus Contendobacter odensis Run_B_J11]|uniref:GCN5-related N-acetyltransferase n=2 Tax=Candidatus Contendibacter odensensis TaxID=1400860 RepID=A0A7U7G879_9GAMM|nr:putative GCN5-related N-acetyltransferase [Candidatus Contendobacter odensis Run_B_J11]
MNAEVVLTMKVKIKRLKEDRADLFFDLMATIYSDSDYMLIEPNEVQQGKTKIKEMVINLLKQANSTILVAELNGFLVGFVLAKGGEYNRNHHCAYLVIGIRKDYQGRGIGKQLLEAIDVWAQKTNITRLELTVAQDNQPARVLYEKSGYVEDGMRKKSLYISGYYKDEIYMSKIFT